VRVAVYRLCVGMLLLGNLSCCIAFEPRSNAARAPETTTGQPSSQADAAGQAARKHYILSYSSDLRRCEADARSDSPADAEQRMAAVRRALAENPGAGTITISASQTEPRSIYQASVKNCLVRRGYVVGN
jgi:hypothetical protein